MDTRRSYEMTEAQLARLYMACEPAPYLVAGGVPPASPQENANRFWRALGAELAFDGMSVWPDGRGPRFFSAVATPSVAAPACVCTSDDLARPACAVHGR